MTRRLVVLGLSLSSSWGNGHATTYRALLRAMAARGDDILFLERDVPWYAAHRDLVDPPWCRLEFYDHVDALAQRWAPAIAGADAVIVGSFVPDGVAVARLVQRIARGVTAFYDIDTPVTLARLAAGDEAYLAADLIPGFDLYLSFTGGPTLQMLERVWGARRARPLYCAVDHELYRPCGGTVRWALGYLGTYSPDRQPGLARLLIAAARRRPELRFVVAGPQYPRDVDWPVNVERIEHLPPGAHPAFYSAMSWTLNVTRADMKAAGFSPSVRLFEAASCGTPIISDGWPGLDSILHTRSEIAVAETTDEVLRRLALPATVRASMAAAARAHVLAEHTAMHRAALLDAYLQDAVRTDAGLERVEGAGC